MLSGRRMIWLLAHPFHTPPPSPVSKFLSLKFLVSPAKLTDGECGGSQIIRRREILVIYFSFNTLWDMSEITLLRCDNMHVIFVSVLATL